MFSFMRHVLHDSVSVYKEHVLHVQCLKRHVLHVQCVYNGHVLHAQNVSMCYMLRVSV